jgi:hypothetical protein
MLVPLVVAISVILFGFARSAQAQTISQTMGTSILDYTQSGQASNHPNNVDATWISYSDCESNVLIYVPVTVTVPASGFANYNVRAFATTVTGTDCGVSTSNSGATGVCWQVALSPGTLSAIPVQQVTYEISVRELLRNIGAAAGTNLQYIAGTEAACHVAKQSGAIPLSLQFIVSDLGGNEDSSLQIGLNVELIGPAPPTGITIGVGEGLLKLNWTPVSDPNTQGFNIFIDPLPGQEGTDAGATTSNDAGAPADLVCEDAGFLDGGLGEDGAPIETPVDGGACHYRTVIEASTSQTTMCPSTILTSGVTGILDSGDIASTTTEDDASASTSTDDAAAEEIVSGTAPTTAQLAQIDKSAQIGGGTQTAATVKGLKDGYVYTIAIAAIDNLNDNGPLSTPVCATPAPVDDFYDEYRAAGGLAGGGYCSFEGAGVPTGMGAATVFALCLYLSVARRRRRPS